MDNLKKKHELILKFWQFMKTWDTELEAKGGYAATTDEDWERLTRESNELAMSYKGTELFHLAKDLVLAYMNTVERIQRGVA